MNRNGETSGDNAACTSLSLEENTSTNTVEPIDDLELSIAPNPVDDFLNLRSNSPNSGDYTLIITDMLGRQVYQEAMGLPQGKASSSVDVSQLITGTYTLQLIGNGKMLARQLIKR